MSRGWTWAILLLSVAFLFSGCTYNSNAYPNDQARIVDVLSDEGIDVEIAYAEEEMGASSGSDPFEWGSFVTIRYSTKKSIPEAEKSVLPTIRRVAWEQYPHRLEWLTVRADNEDQYRTYDYPARNWKPNWESNSFGMKTRNPHSSTISAKLLFLAALPSACLLCLSEV